MDLAGKMAHAMEAKAVSVVVAQRLHRLIGGVRSCYHQLLAHAVSLRARNMVCAIRQFGELGGYGYSILGIVKIRGNLNTLNCFLLLTEDDRHGIVRLDIVLDHQRDDAFSSTGLERNIARLKGRLQPGRIWLGILLGKACDITTVIFEFGSLLLHDMLLQSSAAGWRGGSCPNFRFLLCSIRPDTDLEHLLFLYASLDADRLLLLP